MNIDKETLLKSLEENDYYKLTTATALDIGRTKLENLCKTYGIKLPKKPMGVKPKYKNCHDKVNNTYYKMINRCYSKLNKDYEYYGGRGIKVYDRWLESRDKFYEDLKDFPNAFEDGFSLDREDNDGNYEPDNVRFVSHREQCFNRRSNNIVSYKGEEKPITMLADEYGLTFGFIKDRLNLGFSVEEAIEIPKGMKRVTYYRMLEDDKG